MYLCFFLHRNFTVGHGCVKDLCTPPPPSHPPSLHVRHSPYRKYRSREISLGDFPLAYSREGASSPKSGANLLSDQFSRKLNEHSHILENMGGGGYLLSLPKLAITWIILFNIHIRTLMNTFAGQVIQKIRFFFHPSG